jgi:AmmeMemoRadiSam system protein A
MERHQFPELARAAVEHYVLTGQRLSAPVPLPMGAEVRAATFVSLHTADGSLRGCVGTIQPVEGNVALEIIRNGIAAATRDPRFTPVRANELARLQYSVDVLGELEQIGSAGELDPKRYGVIVARGPRRGLLLPDLEGVDSAQVQLAIALEKAGIQSGEPYQLLRFEVRRYA